MSSPYDGQGEVPAPDQFGQPGYQAPPPFAPPTGPTYPPGGYGPPPGYQPAGYQQPGYPPSGYGQYHPQYPPQPWAPPQSTGTNGLAVASMVRGILWLWWVGSVLALIFGYVARSQIKQRPGQGGDGMAIAGIVLGWVGVGLFLIFIIVLLSVDNTTYSLLSGV